MLNTQGKSRHPCQWQLLAKVTSARRPRYPSRQICRNDQRAQCRRMRPVAAVQARPERSALGTTTYSRDVGACDNHAFLVFDRSCLWGLALTDDACTRTLSGGAAGISGLSYWGIAYWRS